MERLSVTSKNREAVATEEKEEEDMAWTKKVVEKWIPMVGFWRVLKRFRCFLREEK